MSEKPTGLWRPMLRHASRSAARGAGLATMRFPVAALLIVLFAIVANLEVGGRSWWPDWPRLLLALSGAAAASVTVRVGAEAHLRRTSVFLIILPASAAALIGTVLWLGEPLSLYAPALLPAAIAAIPLAPFIGRGTAAQFWIFSLWTGVGIVLAFLSVVLFCIGLIAILEMIRFLFGIGLDANVYSHIAVTAVSLVGPLFALGRIPSLEGEGLALPADDRLLAAVRPLFEWVAAPLALTTAVVLHLYGLQVLATGEVPLDEIGWIVTFFLILVLGLRIALDPFLSTGGIAARMFARSWAPMLLFPLAILSYSAWLRIDAHGVTVSRYFLVLGAGIGFAALILQFVRRVRGDIRAIAALPVAFLALSVAGPWSAAEVVGRSQAARIEGASLDDRGQLDLLRSDWIFRAELRTRINELSSVDQLWRLEPYLPPERTEALRLATAPRGPQLREAMLRALDLWTSGPGLDPARSFAAIEARALDLTGYDIAFVSARVSTAIAGTPEQTMAFRFEGTDLSIVYGASRDRLDLSAVLAGLSSDLFVAGAQAETPLLDLQTIDGRHLRIRIDALEIDARARPQSAVLTVLARSAEWR